MICTIWLLLLGGILGFAVPNSESADLTLTFCYDLRNQAEIGYDKFSSQPFSLDSAYDASSVLRASENVIRQPSNCSILASFAHFVAAKTAATQPNRIYSARELIRRAEESGPFHNFPESFNQQIFEQGTRTVTPNYFNVAKPGLSQDGVMYQLRGSVNGANGTFEIGVRPSVSGNTEVIGHRFFRPDP